jgi:sugar (pentulose or hexulose) kinase
MEGSIVFYTYGSTLELNGQQFTAGMLTAEGAKRLDPTGTLQPGIPFCPPEGDAGTGMVATNSVAPRTGNVSAGTSIFAMVVLEKPLSKVYPEIDMVTTPDGAVVAMVHCNNCTSDLNAWVDLLAESAALCGANIDKGALFTLLFNESLHGAPDCGGITPVNYISGESVTHLDAGVPLLLRRPDSAFTLANFMRANIYSAFATLAMGLEILRKENVAVNTLLGHGGIFTTPKVAQKILAAAFDTPIKVMATAAEGGAWGMAVLADYLWHAGQPLADYLDARVFADAASTTEAPDANDVAGFEAFFDRFRKGLPIEHAAIESIPLETK